MEPKVVNKNKNCIFNGLYTGRDLYVTLFQESEREFVVTHNANIKPVSYFTGRETELQDLLRRIEEGRKSVLVSGMGGIGKTHICRKLFEEYLNKHAAGETCPFLHIGYVEYSGDMESSLLRCLKYKEQENPEQNREAAWRELEYLASDGRLLLFVDNVDKPLSVDTGLQRLNGIPGAVILTSRQVSFGDEFEPYWIGFLGMEQCREVYEKIRFGGSSGKVRPEEVPDLEHVIENLAGRHTITVELLAHLARTKLWGVKRLREELEQKGFRLSFHKDGNLVNIQESYEVLYDLTGLTDAEKNILEAFSVFPYIPLAAETCNEWLLSDAGVTEDDDILMGLYQKGWLQLDEQQEGYVMHPVFAQFICEKCKPKWKEHYGLMEECRRSLQVFPNGSVLVECQKYIPFAKYIIEKIDVGEEEYAGQIEFLKVLALLLYWMDERKEAKKLYEKLLNICKGELGKNHLETANRYSDLAITYVEDEEYEKAEELLVKSFRIQKSVLGEGVLYTAGNDYSLAALYIYQEKYEKAKKLLVKSLWIQKKVQEQNASFTARGYYCLAEVYAAQGEYKKAERLYRKSLHVLKNVLDEYDWQNVSCYAGMAVLYEKQKKYEKAEGLYRRSLEICKKKLGENCTETANFYYNLARLYDILNDYEIALDYYFKAYKIFELKSDLRLPEKLCTIWNMMEIYDKWKPKGNFKHWFEEKMKE